MGLKTGARIIENMKYTPFKETEVFQVAPDCKVYEYGGNAAIDGAIAEIDGRYPAAGWARNTRCNEMIFTLEGSGTLHTEAKEYSLTKDTVVLIDPQEKYYFTGTRLRLFLATTPPWSPEQHQVTPAEV